MSRQRAAQDPLVWPRGAIDHGGGAIGAIDAAMQFAGQPIQNAGSTDGSPASRRSRRRPRAVSRSGIAEARPDVRVSTTDCATPGRVSSLPRAAAAAAKAGTPGVSV